ncbi:ribonucleotide reductase N-terminal alpha domain-containing protein [Metabacillus fastidiosus]|uniref:ribonucleotide reductase N-terminal alpha domain-containing protein n=1 Tax=Metabacillus fastidiosus TaxID=1458 RepID=UPI003AF3289C
MSMKTATQPIITNETEFSESPYDFHRLKTSITSFGQDYPSLDLTSYIERIDQTIKQREQYTTSQLTNLLILEGLSNITESEPDWTYFCSQIYLKQLYNEASVNRKYDAGEKYGSFLQLLKTLQKEGIYSSLLLDHYSEEEINTLGTIIDPERDKLFTYIGLRTLADRYLARDYKKQVFELPQERFLIIAMTLMVNEEKNARLKLVEEAYWAMSNLYMTVATPTLSNAGKPVGQLSSCFIDKIDDSLQGIFDSNTDIANLSKAGGGIGVYLGAVRSRGSDIKGYKGVSSGVNHSPLVA